MGVRGLTTYIANRSHLYLGQYELSNSYLVIDGNSAGAQIYRLHCKCNDCFGGDYDKYAHVITSFFETLARCNITPIVIFDGGYEKRKLKTVMDRLKTKAKNSYNLNSVTEGSYSQFPLFLREVFKDVVLKLNIKCVRCEFEADGAIACIAKALGCPLLSYDSDFFIFDALYIPFPTLNINPLRRYNKTLKKVEYYMQCNIYEIDKFLDSFGGMNKENLPILAMLLGNDYMRRREFAAFYKQLKLQKGKKLQNEQQRRIKTLIMWLKNESFTSAFQKILCRFKSMHRRNLQQRMEQAIQSYAEIDTDILEFLNITTLVKNPSWLCTEMKKIDINGDDEANGEATESEGSEDVSSSEEEVELIEEIPRSEGPDSVETVPVFFKKKFKMCQYPPCFMDILTLNCYYCIPQVEERSRTNPHAISLSIISAIHKILRGAASKPLVYYASNENGDIRKNYLNVTKEELPSLCEIEVTTSEKRIQIFLQILGVNDSFVEKCVKNFPPSWHLLLISVSYWVKNGKVGEAYIYSIVLCAIILLYVDKEIGFYRSSKSFLSKYTKQLSNLEGSESGETKINSEISKDINDLIGNITSKDCLLCMKKSILHFQMDQKMRSNLRLYEKFIVHDLCEFQSCLLHIKYLNCLLNFPFPDFSISDIFDGTFIYNVIIKLQKRSNLDMYMKTSFSDCPSILNLFEVILNKISESLLSEGSEMVASSKNVRKRRRKKKASTVAVEENNCVVECSDDDDYIHDENNKFTLLTSCNKRENK